MKYFLACLVTMAISINGFGQGCSDAGFCSLGSLKNHIENDSLSGAKKQRFSLGINYGRGEQNTSTINGYAEYAIKFNNTLAFQSKITGTYATGFLGSAFNVGDVYATFNYSPKVSDANSLSLVGGVKVPVSYGNSKNSEGKPLPLDYQASIGTYDAIGGVNYIIDRRWEFNAAIQVPVIQVNKSTYFPDEFSDPRALEFAPTNQFKRKSDVLARVGYYIFLRQSSIILKPSLSGIYHVGNDSYENRFGQRTGIAGSRGLTLNGSIVATKQLKNGNQIEVFVGTPFIVRKERPDGLTRSAVINFQYTIAF
jgi:hypothetical protein